MRDDHADADPVVMIHSSGMSSRQWRALASALPPGLRAVTPDLLGYGDHHAWQPGASFELAEDVDLVLAVVRALGRPVHLVGHSYGGLLALLAARRLAPADVRRIAVYEPVAWGIAADEPDGPVRRELDAFVADGFFDDAHGGSAAWYRRFVDFWNGPGAWDGMAEPQRAAFLAVGRKVFLEVRALCFDRTPAEAYRELTAPTLVLCGERSPAAERRVCEVLAASLPRATLTTIAGAGHMGPLTRADAVNAAILGHLRGA